MGMIYGIDIGGTNIKLGIVDKDGVILKEGKIRTRAEEGPSAVISRVLEWFNSKRAGFPGSDIIGAGIGCAGLVDRERGFLYSSPNLPRWDNVELGKFFSEQLDVPVVVDNDANCAAYGEFLLGAGRGANNFICITLGTGVGGGMVINGRLYRGETGQAGEIGHIVIKFDEKLRGYQNRGSLEAYIGSAAIVERTKEMLKQESSNPLLDIDRLTVKDIAAAAGKGNELAVRSLRKTGIYFGIGLSNIVHIVNPEVIAVGGGVSAAGELIFKPARETLAEYVIDDKFLDVKIVPAELGNKASFLGAAMMVFNNKQDE
ncbi:MAG: ROK family protein [Candidatus Krumholzibacteriota bacterium]|nr:ROK family protein [Candidatus Krumholzibacteriota bacterium]